MRQARTLIEIGTPGQGLVEISSTVTEWTAEQGMSDGLPTILCRPHRRSIALRLPGD